MLADSSKNGTSCNLRGKVIRLRQQQITLHGAGLISSVSLLQEPANVTNSCCNEACGETMYGSKANERYTGRSTVLFADISGSTACTRNWATSWRCNW